MSWITDKGDVIAFTEGADEDGDGIMFEFILGETYQLSDEQKAEFNASYEFVDVAIDEDADFYQGLLKIAVIRRKSDGKEFGFSFFDDISKHGETYIEMNNWEEDTYDFSPVHPSEAIPTYAFA